MKIDQNSDRRMKILVVDDDPDTCALLTFLLQSRGYDSAIYNSGASALHNLKNERPDLILLDVMMPEMDGLETYEHIQKISNIPVVFLSAMESQENVIKALNSGALDYIRKPFLNDELLTRIGIFFNRHITTNSQYNNDDYKETVRPRTSLIIPTLNEAKNLPLVLPHLPMEWIDEVILVDGHSTDGTVDVARRILPSIKVIMEKKKGKGAAMNTGYRAATGDIIIVLDADGSHDPREIPRFIYALLEGSDLVKGSRFAHGGGTTDMPRYRELGNFGLTQMVNILFSGHLTDLCYGYHAFWRYSLKTININDVNGFEVDTALYVRALQKKLRITEVPSFEGYRFHGIGKLRTFPDGFRVLKTILSEYYRYVVKDNEAPYLGFRGVLDPSYENSYRDNQRK